MFEVTALEVAVLCVWLAGIGCALAVLRRVRRSAVPGSSRGALTLAAAVFILVFGSALAAMALVREVRAGRR
ncbi:hypothetical protein BRM1_08430 [Brevibacterium sp. BRM-1]|uniref:hypothetical protein n=1 Tax=Brevibacterium sp. BRM-1 TaxID=2999062 RepID=UPI00227E71FD|nr:hypothetical protein [Brevibacterium sp. BRM-1]WAL39311.1 hypothetical protein BRM1_08430 [Brevibacterium sp. BRM-1]